MSSATQRTLSRPQNLLDSAVRNKTSASAWRSSVQLGPCTFHCILSGVNFVFAGPPPEEPAEEEEQPEIDEGACCVVKDFLAQTLGLVCTCAT